MMIFNKILWGIATTLIIFIGFFFTKQLKGIQFDFKKLFSSFSKEKKGISSFETLTMSLGSRIGVGSLAGIALAIFYGGIGSIFWIWIITIVTSVNSLVESTLAVLYREKDSNIYKGGPAFYINKGLNLPKLAVVYSIALIIAYIGGFLTIQTNTIALYVNDLTKLSKPLIGVIISLISFYIISRGVKFIAKFTSFMIPIMSVFYLIIVAIIVIINFDKIPYLLINIIKEAFNFKALGFGVISSFIIGSQRGIFATECGIGTGAIVSGSSSTDSPIKQGMIQLLGVYFSTFVICTSTALIILTSPYQNLTLNSINGIEITNFAFNYHLGSFGHPILIILIFFFSFTTIISGYYYGESNLKYLIRTDSNKIIFIFKIVVFIILIIGSIIKSSVLWITIDILVAILSIINVSALLLLKDDVIREWNRYRRINSYDRKRLGYNFKRRI